MHNSVVYQLSQSITEKYIITSTKAEVKQSDRFVRHTVCVQDYCKKNPPISLKHGVMTGPTNWLTFDADPVPDMDHFSTSLTIVG